MDKFDQVVCLYVNNNASEGACLDCGNQTDPLDEYIFVKKDYINNKLDTNSCQWICQECALEYNEEHGYWNRRTLIQPQRISPVGCSHWWTCGHCQFCGIIGPD